MYSRPYNGSPRSHGQFLAALGPLRNPTDAARSCVVAVVVVAADPAILAYPAIFLPTLHFSRWCTSPRRAAHGPLWSAPSWRTYSGSQRLGWGCHRRRRRRLLTLRFLPTLRVLLTLQFLLTLHFSRPRNAHQQRSPHPATGCSPLQQVPQSLKGCSRDAVAVAAAPAKVLAYPALFELAYTAPPRCPSPRTYAAESGLLAK